MRGKKWFPVVIGFGVGFATASSSGFARACSTNLDCPLSAPVCNPNVCVGCGSDTDCVGRGANSVCDMGTGGCVGCLSNADCPINQPHCSGSAGVPGACGACSNDTDCTLYPEAGACQPVDGIAASPGTCRSCSRSNTTACTGATPACYDVSGACQVCTVAERDAGPNAIGCADAGSGHACEGDGGSVFCGCGASTDCDGDHTVGSICDAIAHTCRACAPDAGECPASTVCAVTGDRAGHCVTCTDDSQCTKPMVCNTVSNTCVLPSASDAGSADAAAIDAGSHDASPDATVDGGHDENGEDGGGCSVDPDRDASGATSFIGVALAWLTAATRRRRRSRK